MPYPSSHFIILNMFIGLSLHMSIVLHILQQLVYMEALFQLAVIGNVLEETGTMSLLFSSSMMDFSKFSNKIQIWPFLTTLHGMQVATNFPYSCQLHFFSFTTILIHLHHLFEFIFFSKFNFHFHSYLNTVSCLTSTLIGMLSITHDFAMNFPS